MTYNSVEEMVADICGHKFYLSFKNKLENTIKIKELVVSRVVKNISRKDMADKLGWTIQKLNRFENSDDDEIKPLDYECYQKVLINIR